MDFAVEKRISHFIENQFPQFYQEDGPNFVLFVKAYYEWMEEIGAPIKEARELFNYRDIDNTLEAFLEHFQKKYLYGIPFNVIINKRYLLKHILDVYRSKSSIQGYRLLFRLIYNEDIEIYLPGRDIIKPSHGTWKVPKYIEITKTDGLVNLVGKQITGLYSNTSAVVENYVKEYFDTKQIHILYISNITPKGADFEIGEKIVTTENISNTEIISVASSILGSLESLDIINGGQDFAIGDIIKIAHISNNQIISSGVEGLLRVTDVTKAFGTLFFSIVDGGYGYMANAETFVYRNDSTGTDASFEVGSISSTQTIEYNTDIIADYLGVTIDAATYGFSLSGTANLSSNIGIALSYSNGTFGTIATLSEISTGNGYTEQANIFVRSVLTSNALQGNVSYNTTSNTVTGVNTIFTSIFSNNDIICLRANNSLANTQEYAVIRSVVNSTSITLYGPPTINSTSTAKYRCAPTILPANFALYEDIMYNAEGEIFGENEYISAFPSYGNNVIAAAVAFNSGKGYIEGEIVTAYLYGAISNTVTILSAGNNYTNGDLIIFSGGGAGSPATGYITTNTSGSITSTTVTYVGSGYTDLPTIRIRSANGTDGLLTTTLTEFNTNSEVIGRVNKKGIGSSRGFWSTTKGFLNSDKYIIDSYYYQDYSYEIKVAQPLAKYRDILYNTFHTAGTELFGKFLLISKESANAVILYESNAAIIS